MSLPLGIAPVYAEVDGISALEHAGPGAGNSVFGAVHGEFDKPWLATLSGRRNMQPNVAHQIFRLGDDGVVRDPLGSGMEYRHDGYAAGTSDAVTLNGGEYGNMPIYEPSMDYSNLQSLYSTANQHQLGKLANQLQQLKFAIDKTPALDPGALAQADAQIAQLKQEYLVATAQGAPKDAQQKFTADAVSTIASYSNIYNETDLFPKSQALEVSAMVELMNSEMTGDSTDTLQFFCYRIQDAYLGQRGFWSSGQLAKTAVAGGYNAGTDLNFGALAVECSTLRNDGHGHDIALIADTLLSADPAGQFVGAASNPPWTSSGQSPSIWGTYTPTGSSTQKVVGGVDMFDEALFNAAVAVHSLYLTAYPNGNNSNGGGGGGGSNGGNSFPNSNTASGTTTPTSDAPLLAGAAIVAAIAALAYKGYAA